MQPCLHNGTIYAIQGLSESLGIGTDTPFNPQIPHTCTPPVHKHPYIRLRVFVCSISECGIHSPETSPHRQPGYRGTARRNDSEDTLFRGLLRHRDAR